VKCRGPTAVGVGCCRRVHEATHLVGCFTHEDHGERAQVSAQAEGEVPVWVTL